MIEIDWDKTIEALEFIALCKAEREIKTLKKCFELHRKINFNGCEICKHKQECILLQLQ